MEEGGTVEGEDEGQSVEEEHNKEEVDCYYVVSVDCEREGTEEEVEGVECKIEG